MENKKNKIKVIVPFYNAEKFLERCVNSILTQKYDNFKVIFIDDASTDNSWNLLPHNDERAICIKNEKNVTALPNLHRAIMEMCEPEEIVCIVDGDDFLINKTVLSFINDFYNENDCWLTWGSSMWTNGRKGCDRAVANEEEFNKIRTEFGGFFISHLRTLKAGLYHKIKEQDSTFSCLKDKQGNFYKIAYDVAIFIVLCELAGFDRAKHINKALYIYNRDNPISDDKLNQAGQTNTHLEILKKKPFKKIEKL